MWVGHFYHIAWAACLAWVAQGIVQGWTYDSERVLDIVRCNLHCVLQGRLAGLLLFVAQLLLERGQERVPRERPFAVVVVDRRATRRRNGWRRGAWVTKWVVGVEVEGQAPARIGVCL